MDNDDIVDGEFNRTVANYDGGIIITDGTTIKSYVPFQGHKKNLFLISKRDSPIFFGIWANFLGMAWRE